MVVVVLLSVGLGWFAFKMQEARRQREAVKAIEESGGGVLYDYEWESYLRGQEKPKLPAPAWLRRLIGVDFFSDVVTVNLRGDDASLEHLVGPPDLDSLGIFDTPVADDRMRRLKKMTKLRHLYLVHTQVTKEGIEELRQSLPNCEIHSYDEPSHPPNNPNHEPYPSN